MLYANNMVSKENASEVQNQVTVRSFEFKAGRLPCQWFYLINLKVLRKYPQMPNPYHDPDKNWAKDGKFKLDQ
jgi:hypothetical protein